MNEFIFIFHALIVCTSTLGSLFLGRDALVSFICLQGVLANLFVIKQMTIFGLDGVCSDVFIVGSLFGLNLLQEFYGKSIAKKTIIINFVLMFFYLAMTQFHLLYQPNHFDSMHMHYQSILGITPRLIIASIIAFYVMQVLDVYIFGFLKKLFKNKHITSRNFIALAISMTIDTILFASMALYCVVGSLWSVIVIGSAVKILASLCCIPLTFLAKRIKIPS